jgi:hypothetical protein
VIDVRQAVGIALRFEDELPGQDKPIAPRFAEVELDGEEQ